MFGDVFLNIGVYRDLIQSRFPQQIRRQKKIAAEHTLIFIESKCHLLPPSILPVNLRPVQRIRTRNQGLSGYVPNPPKGYRNTGVDPVDINAQHWAQYKDLPPAPDTKPTPMGCVFAKSCNLPDGEINHTNPAGFVPVEKLADYGLWVVLATGAAITAEGTSLQLVGGSTTGSVIAQRLGGSLALGLLESAGTLAAGAAIGTVALLMPNTSLAPDSAFYKTDQYATLETGRTRVRVNVKTLPDGSVNAYGFYTGGKKDWKMFPSSGQTKTAKNSSPT